MQTQAKSKQFPLEVRNKLPSSIYAKVYKATDSTTGKTVVIKRLDTLPPKVRDNQIINTMIEREEILIKDANEIKNPYIVELLDSFKEGHMVYLVMKYYQTGHLGQYLEANEGKLPEERALELFNKICQGYQWCVTKEVVHRDLKVDNIFMDGDNPALGDFGSARYFHEKCQLREEEIKNVELSMKPFSLYNLSPEQVMGKDYDTGADIWGLGLILYEMIYGKFPFGEKDDPMVGKHILEQEVLFEEKVSCTDDCKALILHMLHKNKSERIKWEELINHQLLKSSPKADPIQNESLGSIPCKRVFLSKENSQEPLYDQPRDSDQIIEESKKDNSNDDPRDIVRDKSLIVSEIPLKDDKRENTSEKEAETLELLTTLQRLTGKMNQARDVITTCQGLVGEGSDEEEEFLPHNTFMIFIYGLLKVGIINLRFVGNYPEISDTNNPKFKSTFDQCKNRLQELETIFYAKDFCSELDSIKLKLELDFTNKMLGSLTDMIHLETIYIKNFIDWIRNESGKSLVDGVWKYQDVLKKHASEASRLVYDIIEILKENLLILESNIQKQVVLEILFQSSSYEKAFE